MEFIFFPVFGLFWLVSTIVWIWAIVDAVRVEDDSRFQSGNKIIWVLIIVLTHIVGAILYFLIGRPKEGTPPRATGTGGRQIPERSSDGAPPIPPPPPGTP
jgi:hypothetical protein